MVDIEENSERRGEEGKISKRKKSHDWGKWGAGGSKEKKVEWD